jgi:hypothetical protein
MATRITLATACCGKRREQCLSNGGSLRFVRFHGERRAPHGALEQQRISEPRTRRCPAPGAHGDASGRAAQFCQELPVDARLMFKTSVGAKNEICLVSPRALYATPRAGSIRPQAHFRASFRLFKGESRCQPRRQGASAIDFSCPFSRPCR